MKSTHGHTLPCKDRTKLHYVFLKDISKDDKKLHTGMAQDAAEVQGNLLMTSYLITDSTHFRKQSDTGLLNPT